MKASSPFISAFILCHSGAEGDHSELASICGDGGPGTLAASSKAPPPLRCLLPAPLQRDSQSAASAAVITERSDLCSGARRRFQAALQEEEATTPLDAAAEVVLKFHERFLHFTQTFPNCAGFPLRAGVVECFCCFGSVCSILH